MTTINKRRYPRVQDSFSAYIIDMSDTGNALPLDMLIEAETVDFSKKGLKIKTGCTLAVGTYVMVLINTEGKKSMCFCRVMWKRSDGRHFFYGLFFKEWIQLDPKLGRLFSSPTPDADFFRILKNIPASKAA